MHSKGARETTRVCQGPFDRRARRGVQLLRPGRGSVLAGRAEAMASRAAVQSLRPGRGTRAAAVTETVAWWVTWAY